MSDDIVLEAARRRIASLSALPVIDARLVKVLAEPDISIQYEQLRDLLYTDPALAARVLKVANSAFYGGARSIRSIERALLVLGTLSVAGIAMAASFDSSVRRMSGVQSAFAELLQRHSVRTAVAAKDLAARGGNDAWRGEAAFVLGLLHDLGWLVQLQIEVDKKLPLAVATTQASATEAMPAVETDHALLTAALLTEWQLPPEFVDAVRHHGQPPDASEASGGRGLLVVADQCALLADQALPDEVRLAAAQLPLEAYHLTEAELARLAAQYAAEADSIHALMR